MPAARSLANDQRLTTFIQSHLLDVVRNGWVHKSPKRLSRSRGLANCRRRNRLIDLIQQMDRHAAQYQVPRGRLLLERTRYLLPRSQARRQRVRNVSQGVARPAGHHKLTLAKQRLRLMPFCDIREGID